MNNCNKNIIYLLIGLLFTCGCKHSYTKTIDNAQQGKNFKHILKNDTIKSNELNSAVFSKGTLRIKKIIISSHEIKEQKKYFQNNSIYDYPIPISNVFFTSLDKNDWNVIPENYIVLGGKKFLYSELYGHKRKILVDEKIRPEVTNIYEIETKNNYKYIAVFAKDMSYNNSYSNELVFLFSISRKNIDKAFFLDDTMFITDNFFGDYNKNGYIDFLSFSKNIDTIFCKEVIGDKIVIIKDRYLVINAFDGIGQVFTINFEKSLWK